MNKKGLSQEGLKLIACVTMLIDHIGAVLVIPGEGEIAVAWAHVVMRCIGRISFPIFCFLLAEGAAHTRNPKKYALRLGIGLVLAELPYDLAFHGKLTLDHQNVMFTLLLGFCMIEAMKRTKGFWKLLWILPFWCAAEILHTDYAGDGILLIAMFALVKGLPGERWVRVIGMFLLLWDNMALYSWGLGVPIRYSHFKMLSAIPILCYDGRKISRSKVLQWGFYLFYSVHITILVLIRLLI